MSATAQLDIPCLNYKCYESIHTQLCPDVLITIPTILQPNPCIITGYYELDSAANTKIGQIELTPINLDKNSATFSQSTQIIQTNAIFDLKLNRGISNASSSPVYLASADAAGILNIYHYNQQSNQLIFTASTDSDQDSNNSNKAYSLLSVDWNNSNNLLSCSNNRGEILLYQINYNEGNVSLTLLQRWNAHMQGIELWTTHFSVNDDNLLYSGGDDCVLRGWDVRIDNHNNNTASFTDRNSHTAGVCSILTQPNYPNYLFTGSYDCNLRIFDVRKGNKPVLCTEYNTDGGVWRMKFHPNLHYSNHLLLSAMHAGFQIVKLQTNCSASNKISAADNGEPNIAAANDNESKEEIEFSVELVSLNSAHKSLAYDADWINNNPSGNSEHNEKERLLCCSASFYDKYKQLWTVETVK
jgi:WD40 repeat protein